MVAAPAVAISADQMRVFYRGVVNPVSVSAAGVSPTDLQISAIGANNHYVTKGPGKYEFTFTGTGTCNISVSAKGKSQGPPISFRVKPLPKAEPKIGGKFAPSEMKKGELSLVGAVGAGANGFDFTANFIVKSYSIVGKVKNKLVEAEGNGANFDEKARALFKGVDANTKIFIDITVVGPDGQTSHPSCSIKALR